MLWRDFLGGSGSNALGVSVLSAASKSLALFVRSFSSSPSECESSLMKSAGTGIMVQGASGFSTPGSLLNCTLFLGAFALVGVFLPIDCLEGFMLGLSVWVSSTPGMLFRVRLSILDFDLPNALLFLGTNLLPLTFN